MKGQPAVPATVRASLPELLEALAVALRAEDRRLAEAASQGDLLKVDLVAQHLAVDDSTVYELVKCGELRAIKVRAGAIRIERDELERFKAARRTRMRLVNEGDKA